MTTHNTAKLAEDIAFFEKMRQTMPLDRASLEFLAIAYEQTNDHHKRHQTLIELAETLLNENDLENAQIIAAKLSTTNDPTTRNLINRIAAALQTPISTGGLQTAPPLSASQVGRTAPEPPPTTPTTSSVAITASATSAEITLVWHWIDNNYLTREIGMEIIHTLTSTGDSQTVPPPAISALATLHTLHPELTDTILTHMQAESRLPYLPPELLTPDPNAYQLLSPEYTRIKAVHPWATMGHELLVALLNPLSQTLQNEIRQLTHRPCHFYLTHPTLLVH